MSDCVIHSPRRLLRGVTRTVTLAIKDAAGDPLDLTGVDLTVEVRRDGSGDKYVPTVDVRGEDNNLIVFVWPADKQNVGLHTIDVRGDFGEAGVSRTNWHGPDGIVIVEWAIDTSSREVADLTVEEVTMDGTMETSAGNTNYYIKPEGGIPSSDMTEAVQQSLALADSAYQKPAGGIPGTDLAPGVIPEVSDVVRYSAQTLTDAQKAQARTNIGAYAKPAGGIPASDLAAGVIPAPELFVATYESTPFADIVAAYKNGKIVVCMDDNAVTYQIAEFDEHSAITFYSYDAYAKKICYISVDLANAWEYEARYVSNFDGRYSSLTGTPVIPSVPPITTDISSSKTSTTTTVCPKAVVDYAGDLSDLQTTDKSSLVAAINEALQGGGGGTDNAVQYVEQTLTSEQQAQARTNIGAGTYSKPSGGIPAADLAAGVIPTVPTISTDITADASSDTKTASPKAVKTYVDGAIPASEIYWATYGTTTATEIIAANAAGKAVLCLYDSKQYQLVRINNGECFFSAALSNITYRLTCNASNVWTGTVFTDERESNKVTSLSSSSTDTQYPSAKAVYDAVSAKYTKPSGGIPAADIAAGVIPTVPAISTDITSDATSDTKTTSPKAVKTFVEGKGYGTYSKPSGGIPATDLAAGVIPSVPTISTDIDADKSSTTKTASPSAVYNEVHPAIVTTQPQGGFAPNVTYDLGTLTGTVTFALASPTDNTVANPYYWTFETSSTAPTITWPSGLTWLGDSAPTISASKHYEIMVRNGYANALEFSLPSNS